MIKIYVKQSCPHCEGIVIPEGVNAVKIDVNNGYEGFVPPQVPCLQLNGLNIAGGQNINNLLITIKTAQDGGYSI